MSVFISQEVKSSFPDIKLCTALVSDVDVNVHTPLLDEEFLNIEREIKGKLSLDSLKDYGNIRIYRDFYWRIGIDPTKQRPAAEALIRRILQGRSIPRINAAVDCINLASIKFMVSIAAYDFDKIVGKINLRFSRDGELFLGIGESEFKPIPKQLVLADDEKIVGLYPHRDSELSKITPLTKNIIMISCGVPGISIDVLFNAIDFASKLLENYCHGKTLWIKLVY
ncbi:MAG: phenylalanine--tRNA ligase beta subunit-related protein [Candidatus Methanomethylicia archaeon]